MNVLKTIPILLLCIGITGKAFSNERSTDTLVNLTLETPGEFPGNWQTGTLPDCDNYEWEVSDDRAYRGSESMRYHIDADSEECVAAFYKTISIQDVGEDDTLVVSYTLYRGDERPDTEDQFVIQFFRTSDNAYLGAIGNMRHHLRGNPETTPGWYTYSSSLPLEQLRENGEVEIDIEVLGMSDGGENIYMDALQLVHIKYEEMEDEPELAVTAPSGGDIFTAGSETTIEWTQENVNEVNIAFSEDGGMTWTDVAENVDASMGSYDWEVPETETEEAHIRLQDADDENLTSITDPFSIEMASQPLVLLTPAAGDTIAEETYNITWEVVDTEVANINIEWSSDAGVTWETVAEDVNAADQLFEWEVPDMPTLTAMMRIEDVDDANIYDETDGTFTILDLNMLITHEALNSKIYPNPTSGQVSVEMATPLSEAAEVAVINLQGKTIQRKKVAAGKSTFDLNISDKGIYMVQITGNEGIATHKIVVE